MHVESALFSWCTELLAFASRQFAHKIVDHSARYIRIWFDYPLIAGGGGKRLCIYVLVHTAVVPGTGTSTGYQGIYVP